jgi:hypothetical protein
MPVRPPSPAVTTKRSAPGSSDRLTPRAPEASERHLKSRRLDISSATGPTASASPDGVPTSDGPTTPPTPPHATGPTTPPTPPPEDAEPHATGPKTPAAPPPDDAPPLVHWPRPQTALAGSPEDVAVRKYLDIASRLETWVSSNLRACVVARARDQLSLIRKCDVLDRNELRFGHHLLLLAKELAIVPSTEYRTCDVVAQPCIDISSVHTISGSARGTVMFVTCSGENLVIKWTPPINLVGRKHDPYSLLAHHEDALSELIATSAMSAANLKGLHPFAPVMYGAFCCGTVGKATTSAAPMTFNELSNVRTTSCGSSENIGVAIVTKYVPFRLVDVIKTRYFTNDHLMQLISIKLLVLCAIHISDNAFQITHNDIHTENVRCERTRGHFYVRMHNKWYRVKSDYMPIIIDWGYVCGRNDSKSICSQAVVNTYSYEKPPNKHVDSGHFIRSLYYMCPTLQFAFNLLTGYFYATNDMKWMTTNTINYSLIILDMFVNAMTKLHMAGDSVAYAVDYDDMLTGDPQIPLNRNPKVTANPNRKEGQRWLLTLCDSRTWIWALLTIVGVKEEDRNVDRSFAVDLRGKMVG